MICFIDEVLGVGKGRVVPKHARKTYGQWRQGSTDC